MRSLDADSTPKRKIKIQRTLKQRLTCLQNAVQNAQKHRKAGDPKRMYSQYIRYALNEFDEQKERRFSSDALSLNPNRKKKFPELVHDHMIPHAFVLNKLLSLKEPSHKALAKVINKYYQICVITKEEDQILNRQGLRSKMPESWNEIPGDRDARYKIAGIRLSPRLS